MSLTRKARPRIQDRKRQAHHHRRGKSYMKPYWPYIPMLAIVALGIAVNSILGNGAGVLGSQANLDKSDLLQYTNQDRSANHDNPLVFSSQLSQAAQNKADDMVKNNYWAHISPSGVTPWTWIINSGYQFQQAGENLAYGFTTSESVVQAWMNSPEHRANMLNSNFEDVGFGIAESANYVNQGPKLIVVAEYGEPLIAVPTAKSSPTVVQPAALNVSRLSLLTGSSATWSELAVTAIVSAGAAVILVKHGIYFRRLVTEGEEFIIHHPLLDIIIVFICTSGVVLIHTAGRIG